LRVGIDQGDGASASLFSLDGQMAAQRGFARSALLGSYRDDDHEGA
jgi:hypothetical protein